MSYIYAITVVLTSDLPTTWDSPQTLLFHIQLCMVRLDIPSTFEKPLDCRSEDFFDILLGERNEMTF